MSEQAYYIRPIQSVTEFQAVQTVQRQTFGFGPEDTVMHLPMMVALQKYGGQVLGAFCARGDGQEELIGFSLAFLGKDEVSGEYFLYSQLAAALSEWQSQGVGLALKATQREAALARGYRLMRWSFDPLLARNAYFNLAKLGAVACLYIPNMYGTGRGELFGQLDTDRLTVDWELNSARVVERVGAAKSGRKPTLPLAEYAAAPDLVEVRWLGQNVPEVSNISLALAAPTLKLEIPSHYKQVQQFDFGLAEEWRTQTRAIFSHYLANGYEVSDFFTQAGDFGQRAYYILNSKEI